MQFDRACDLARRNGKKLVPSTSTARAYDLIDEFGDTDLIFQKQLSEMEENDFLEFYLDGGQYEKDEEWMAMTSIINPFEEAHASQHR